MKSLIFALLFLPATASYSQQTVGLFTNSPESYDGYTLFSPISSLETYLINNCGEKVHSWSSTYKPGLSSYLMENGVLLRTGRIQGMGGGSGIVEMIDWDGNVIWDYSAMDTHGRQHHDIELLPNGNILLIVWDERSAADVAEAGSSTVNPFINSEQIIEIQPNLATGTAEVVWEWKAWDHLVQDVDSTKDDFGTVADHPERIDINFLNHNNSDWLHINAVDYHPEFDQIILSVHGFSEFWIIDHSTTTAEAVSSEGGVYGQGGDLLYRWGNPQAYDHGDPADQKLFLQHNTHWIEPGLADEGKILLFNNQAGTLESQEYSAVGSVELPVDANGFYTYDGGAYGPEDFDWIYTAAVPTDFYSNILSGVQRLPNGNTLVCQGVGGQFFEIDPTGNIVWRYINPVNEEGPLFQGNAAIDNFVFRCTRIAADYAGLQGKSLEAQGYIEFGSTFSCDLVTATHHPLSPPQFSVFPNPAIDLINIEWNDPVSRAYEVKLYDPTGQMVVDLIMKPEDSRIQINASHLSNGLYYLHLSSDSEILSKPVIFLGN